MPLKRNNKRAAAFETRQTREFPHSPPPSHRRALSVEAGQNQKLRFAKFALAMRNHTESRPTQHTAVVALRHQQPGIDRIQCQLIQPLRFPFEFALHDPINPKIRSSHSHMAHRALQSDHSPWLSRPPLSAAHWIGRPVLVLKFRTEGERRNPGWNGYPSTPCRFPAFTTPFNQQHASVSTFFWQPAQPDGNRPLSD